MVQMEVTSVVTRTRTRLGSHNERSVTSTVAIVTLAPDDVTQSSTLGLWCHLRNITLPGGGDRLPALVKDAHLSTSTGAGTVSLCLRPSTRLVRVDDAAVACVAVVLDCADLMGSTLGRDSMRAPPNPGRPLVAL